jgi:hypothetical protein
MSVFSLQYSHQFSEEATLSSNEYPQHDEDSTPICTEMTSGTTDTATTTTTTTTTTTLEWFRHNESPADKISGKSSVRPYFSTVVYNGMLSAQVWF